LRIAEANAYHLRQTAINLRVASNRRPAFTQAAKSFLHCAEALKRQKPFLSYAAQCFYSAEDYSSGVKLFIQTGDYNSASQGLIKLKAYDAILGLVRKHRAQLSPLALQQCRDVACSYFYSIDAFQ
jgi:hypothetical protein